MREQGGYLTFSNLAEQSVENVPDSVYAMDEASQFDKPHGLFEIFPTAKPSVDEQRAAIAASGRKPPSDQSIGYWPPRMNR